MKRPAPLAEFLDSCLGPTIAKQGFSGSDIIVSWPEIVGERRAAYSQPVKVEWPRRASPDGPADPSTLVIRTESAFALELQHLAPVIIERVNAFYGWRCVGGLVRTQRQAGGPAPPKPLPAPGPADRAGAPEAARAVEDEGLRGALERLGSAVLAAERRDRGGTGSPPMPHSS